MALIRVLRLFSMVPGAAPPKRSLAPRVISTVLRLGSSRTVELGAAANWVIAAATLLPGLDRLTKPPGLGSWGIAAFRAPGRSSTKVRRAPGAEALGAAADC